MKDVSAQVDPGSMPCCPLCDNAILTWEAAAIVESGGSKALAHGDCVDALKSDGDDEYHAA